MSTFTIKTNDLTPAIQMKLKDGAGKAIDLTTATKVRFIMKAVGASTAKVARDATIVGDRTLGVVRHDWQSGDTDTAGEYRAEWEITFPTALPATVPSESYDTILISRDLG